MHLWMNKLGIVQVPGACPEAGLLRQSGRHAQLIQLVFNAQAHSPAAEGAVKGIGDVEHHLYCNAAGTCQQSSCSWYLSAEQLCCVTSNIRHDTCEHTGHFVFPQDMNLVLFSGPKKQKRLNNTKMNARKNSHAAVQQYAHM